MNRVLGGLSIAAWVLALAACAGVDPAPADSEDDVANDRALSEMALVPEVKTKRACEASTTPGYMACLARIRLGNDGAIHPLATPPAGLGPADLQSAYLIDANGGAGATVAIVDAQDDAERRGRPRRLPHDLRPAALHDGERLLQEGEPDRHGEPAAGGGQGLGDGDRARPRHGVGDLPELQDPPRRGEHRFASTTSAPR